MSVSEIIGAVGSIIGAIGGLIGIVAFIEGRIRDRQHSADEEGVWKMFSEMKKESSGHIGGQMVFEYEPGSREFVRAEILVERGLLQRAPMGGYWLSW